MLDSWFNMNFFWVLQFYPTQQEDAWEHKKENGCICVWVGVCVKDNIEYHRKNKGNPLIKAILFVIGDLFVSPPAPLTHPVKQYGNGHVRRPRLTGLSIFAYALLVEVRVYTQVE